MRGWFRERDGNSFGTKNLFFNYNSEWIILNFFLYKMNYAFAFSYQWCDDDEEWEVLLLSFSFFFFVLSFLWLQPKQRYKQWKTWILERWSSLCYNGDLWFNVNLDKHVPLQQLLFLKEWFESLAFPCWIQDLEKKSFENPERETIKIPLTTAFFKFI